MPQQGGPSTLGDSSPVVSPSSAPSHEPGVEAPPAVTGLFLFTLWVGHKLFSLAAHIINVFIGACALVLFA